MWWPSHDLTYDGMKYSKVQVLEFKCLAYLQIEWKTFHFLPFACCSVWKLQYFQRSVIFQKQNCLWFLGVTKFAPAILPSVAIWLSKYTLNFRAQLVKVAIAMPFCRKSLPRFLHRPKHVFDKQKKGRACLREERAPYYCLSINKKWLYKSFYLFSLQTYWVMSWL